MMVRRRAPGGGRKPAGDFSGNSAALTMRITTATRESLEAACKKSGRSLGQEAQTRLDWSFAEDRKRRLDDRRRHVRVLSEAISLVTEYIERATGKWWCDDAFTGTAVRFGIERLLLQYAPKDDPQLPPNVKTATAEQRTTFTVDGSPADVGATQAAHVIAWIESSPHPDDMAVGRQVGVVPDEWETRWRLFRDLNPARWLLLDETTERISARESQCQSAWHRP